MSKPRKMNSKLDVKVFARHGDTCGNAPHCASLGCIHFSADHTRRNIGPDDWFLVAQFMYLQEAIDYCQEGQRKGVSMALLSTIVPRAPYWSEYPAGAKGPVSVSGQVQELKCSDLGRALEIAARDPFQTASPVHDPDVTFSPTSGRPGYLFHAITSKGMRMTLQASQEFIENGWDKLPEDERALMFRTRLEQLGCTVQPAPDPEPICTLKGA